MTIHEFGHFWVARRCGVRVEQFSIGFGAPLVTWTDKLGTEFRLAVLPLGGFVKMLDCLLYTSPSPRDRTRSRMPSSA